MSRVYVCASGAFSYISKAMFTLDGNSGIIIKTTKWSNS